MAILLIPANFNPNLWLQSLKHYDPTLTIHIWPAVPDPEEIEFAVVWRYPSGELLKYPNLKCISSMGAGVDHIMSDSQRPKIPVVRIVDDCLSRDMAQYIVLSTLNYMRDFDYYHEAQLAHQWRPKIYNNNTIVGVMGLGEMGYHSILCLHQLGINVIGWSRTPKQIKHIKTYAGDEQFSEFLKQTNILICLLPLTSKTKQILNHKSFNLLPKGAYIINAARGEHLAERDLLQALASGQIAGACLDVFNDEPLPANHPFWSHQKIRITPHIASVTNPLSAAKQVVENYHRLKNNQPLINCVEITREY